MSEPSIAAQMVANGTKQTAAPSIASQLRAADDAAVNAALDIASKQNPEHAASALRTGFDVSVSPEILQENDRQRRRLGISTREIQASPALFRFFQDPSRAAAAYDDVGTLGRMAEALGAAPFTEERASIGAVLSQRLRRGDAMIDRADAAYKMIFDDSPVAASDFELQDARLKTAAVPRGGNVAELLGPAAEQLPLLAQTVGAGVVGAGTGGAAGAALAFVAGQLGPQVATPEEALTVPAGAIAGAGIGGRAGSAMRIFQIEAGNAFADFRELKDAAGAPIDPLAAKGAALAVGGINAGLEFASLGFLLRALPGGRKLLAQTSKSGAKAAMAEALKHTSTRTAMARIGKDYLAALGVETTTEALQATVNATAENILDSTLGTGERLFPSADQLNDIALEATEAFKATLVLGGAGATVRVGGAVAHEALRARSDAKRLAALSEAAEESKLRQRLPQLYESLVNEMGQDSGLASVFLPSQRIFALAEAGALDIGGLSEQTQDQLREARITGGDVAVPLGEYLARVPVAVRQQVAGDARLSVTGLSPAEAEAVAQVAEQELSSEAAPVEAASEIVQPGTESAVAQGDLLYHGTGRDFTSFDLGAEKTTLGGFSRHGVSLSPDIKVAARYARDFNPETGGKVLVVRANVANTLDLTAQQFEKLQTLVTKVDTGQPLTELEDVGLEMLLTEKGVAFVPGQHPIDALKAAGFDSIAKDAGRHGVAERELLVFDPQRLEIVQPGMDSAAQPPQPSVVRGSSVFADLSDDAMAQLVAAEQRVTAERLAVRSQVEAQKQRARDAAAQERARHLAAEQKRLRPIVEKELASSPVWRVREWLTSGALTHEADLRALSGLAYQKLDRELLIKRYGADTVAALPQNIIARGGVAPDVLAELFGFNDADEMLLALMDTRSGFNEAVKLEVNLRASSVVEADPTLEAVSEVGADDALMDLLVLEEKFLAEKLGQPPMATQVLKAAAEAIIGSKAVASLRPAQYRVNASRQAVTAVAASRTGAISDALVAKRREMLNRHLDTAARKARAKAAKDVAALRKFTTLSVRKRIGLALGTYQEQIDALLARVDLRRSDRRVQRSQSLAEWIKEQEAEGETVVIPSYLRAEAEGMALKTHWSRLTPTQLSDVRHSVENIAHLAALKNELTLRQQKRQLEEVEADLVRELEDNVTRTAKRSSSATATAIDRARGLARGLDASLTIPEFLIDFIGGADPQSAWRQAIFEPLEDALNRFNEMWSAYGLKVSQMMDQYDRATQAKYRTALRESRLLDTDGRPLQLSKWNVLVMALNLGNASNRDKLLRGYGWDPVTVQDVLETHMTAEDWAWVQSVWDTVGELWPQIAELERRLTGVVPPKIQPMAVETPFGTFAGGYFPVVYDPTRSQLAERNQLVDLFSKQPNGVARATTGHGFTEARTKVARPILLETSVISTHLHDVILDLTHRDTLLQVQRVLKRSGLEAALKKALGPEFSFRQFWLPWLQSIAGQQLDGTPIAGWSRLVRSLRLNASTFKLGFRATTLLMQTGGHFNGFRMLREALPELSNVEVGKFWLGGVLDAMADVRSGTLAESVMAESTFMRHRVTAFDRDGRDVIRHAQFGHEFTDDVRAFGMSLIGQMQLRTVDVPIWLSARRVAIEVKNMAPADAVRFADSIVRKSQASGEVMSQSAVLRSDNEFWRSLTMFYSYSNVVYNQLRAAGRIATVRNLPSFLAAYLFYQVMPELYAQMVRATVRLLEGRDDDDRDERELLASATQVMLPTHTVPLVRDLAGGVSAAIDPRQSFRLKTQGATGIVAQEVGNLAQAANSGEADRMMVAFARSVSLALGLPSDWLLSMADRAAKSN